MSIKNQKLLDFEKECLCGYDAQYSLFKKMNSLQDGFKYNIFCDEKNKRWVIREFYGNVEKNNNKHGESRVYVCPFGSRVENTLDAYLSMNPKSPLHDFLIDRTKLNDEEKKQLDNIYELNCNRLNVLLYYLKEMKINPEAQNDIKLKWNIWRQYRYFEFNDIWNSAMDIWADWSEGGEYIFNLLDEYVTKNIKFDYRAWNLEDDNSRIGLVCFCNNCNILFALDLYQILINQSVQYKICKRCENIFFGNNARSIYCRMCKMESNKIRNDNRKKNPERYLHKQITDRLNYLCYDTGNFLNESNYYWDIVRGKSVEFNPKYRNDIKTKSAYMAWLLETRDSLKIEKRHPASM